MASGFRAQHPRAGIGSASEAGPGFFRQILDEIRKRAVTGVVLGLTTVFVGALGAAWVFGQAYVHDQVVEIISAEMKDSESDLSALVEQHISEQLNTPTSKIGQAFSKHVSEQISASLEGKVGALSSGSFYLDSATPTNSVHVFIPPEHNARLYLKVTELQPGQQVVLLAPSGNRMVVKEQGVFDVSLDSFVRGASNPQDDAIASVLEAEAVVASPVQGELIYLYTITFQIFGQSGETSAARPPACLVQYLVLVSPPISLARQP